MEKKTDPSLFVNDGSFMERFKQIQQQEGTPRQENKSAQNVSGTSTPKVVISKTNVAFKVNDSRKTTPASSGGKLAFSLKQKSKLVAPPVKLGDDEDEDEAVNETPSMPSAALKRQKLGNSNASEQLLRQSDVAPTFPSDPTVKIVADKLASFVAKNGRQFENITRQKNPGDSPFKFLFDKSCSDYKYYEYQLREEEKALSRTRDLQNPQGDLTTPANKTSSSQRAFQHSGNYQIPASALYEASENTRASGSSSQPSVEGSGEYTAPQGSDPLAMMEYYMKKAAAEEKFRPPKSSKDEMPPPASLHQGLYLLDGN
ncbi:hypothetical protein Leryth_017943 [Lithospermum erythrorhizon]|nr:hypothetical protein Leryth_017943 [Lithospermum erythrorhizon]